MSEVCKFEYRDDGSKGYTISIQELEQSKKNMNRFESESATYVDVLHFVRDILSLLDFSGIIREKK